MILATRPIVRLVLGMLCLALLSHCGGSGSSSSQPPTPVSASVSQITVRGLVVPDSISQSGEIFSISASFDVMGSTGAELTTSLVAPSGIIILNTPINLVLSSSSQSFQVTFQAKCLSPVPAGTIIPFKLVVQPKSGPQATLTANGIAGPYPISVQIQLPPFPTNVQPGQSIQLTAQVMALGPPGGVLHFHLEGNQASIQLGSVSPSTLAFSTSAPVPVSFTFVSSLDTPPDLTFGIALVAESDEIFTYEIGWGSTAAYPFLEFNPPAEIAGWLALTPGSVQETTQFFHSIHGYTGRLHLQMLGLPAGVTATPSSEYVDIAADQYQSVVWTIHVDPSTDPFVARALIQAEDASGLIRSIPWTLKSNYAPSFQVAAPLSPLTLKKGETRSIPVAVDSLNGYSGIVTVFASGLPEGVTSQPTQVQLAPGSSAQGMLSITASTTLRVYPISYGFNLGASDENQTTSYQVAILNLSDQSGIEMYSPKGRVTASYGEATSWPLTVRSFGGAIGLVQMGQVGDGQNLRYDPQSFTLAANSEQSVTVVYGEDLLNWNSGTEDGFRSIGLSATLAGWSPVSGTVGVMQTNLPHATRTSPIEPVVLQLGTTVQVPLTLQPVSGLSGNYYLLGIYTTPISVVDLWPNTLYSLGNSQLETTVQLTSYPITVADSGVYTSTAVFNSETGQSPSSRISFPFLLEIPNKPGFSAISLDKDYYVSQGTILTLPIHVYSLSGFQGIVHVSIQGPRPWSMPTQDINLGSGDHQVVEAQVHIGHLSPGVYFVNILGEAGSNKWTHQIRLHVDATP